MDRCRNAGRAVTLDERWNHNIHYYPLVLRAVPADCQHLLEVGCGEGILARALRDAARHVTAIDLDAPTIERARRSAASDNVDYRVGDFLTYPFKAASFDAVVSVAALHHMGTAVALERMRDVLRPGGTLAVVGLARSRYPHDLIFDTAGAIGTRVHKLTKGYWETSAPKVWPASETFGETRRIATRTLPGARYRRHLLWRYSLVWRKPTADSCDADGEP